MMKKMKNSTKTCSLVSLVLAFICSAVLLVAMPKQAASAEAGSNVIFTEDFEGTVDASRWIVNKGDGVGSQLVDVNGSKAWQPPGVPTQALVSILLRIHLD